MTVISDWDLLNTKISSIKSASMSMLSAISEDNVEYGSSTIVPNCESTIINKNKENIIILLNKLNTEIDAILSIGESIKDLDKFLGREAMLLEYNIQEPYSVPTENYMSPNNNQDINLSGDTTHILDEYDRLNPGGEDA